MNCNINQEIWKDIKGFEGLYQVSNTGKVRSLDREITKPNKYGEVQNFKLKGKELRFNDNGKGYLSVQLGRGNRKYVHRLVAEAFVDNPNNSPSINHIDNNTKNNKASNVEWVTQQENIQHKVKQGRQHKGEKIPSTKLNENDVREIKKLLKEGVPQSKIAEMYGVTQTPISKIKRGVTWSYVV